MDSIKDLLTKKEFEQPDEIKQIKDFVKAKFDEEPSVKLTKNSIIITVSSAALAGALRMHMHHLAKDLRTEKKLILRIA